VRAVASLHSATGHQGGGRWPLAEAVRRHGALRPLDFPDSLSVKNQGHNGSP
jgi:hypothetical protein